MASYSMQSLQSDLSKKNDFSKIAFMQSPGCCPDLAYLSCFHFMKLNCLQIRYLLCHKRTAK